MFNCWFNSPPPHLSGNKRGNLRWVSPASSLPLFNKREPKLNDNDMTTRTHCGASVGGWSEHKRHRRDKEVGISEVQFAIKRVTISFLWSSHAYFSCHLRGLSAQGDQLLLVETHLGPWRRNTDWTDTGRSGYGWSISPTETVAVELR